MCAPARRKESHWSPTDKFIINDAKWGSHSLAAREGKRVCAWRSPMVPIKWTICFRQYKKSVNRALFLTKKNPQKSKQLLHEVGMRTYKHIHARNDWLVGAKKDSAFRVDFWHSFAAEWIVKFMLCALFSLWKNVTGFKPFSAFYSLDLLSLFLPFSFYRFFRVSIIMGISPEWSCNRKII